MRLQRMEEAAHGLKQYHFRVNEQELDQLMLAIDLANGVIPREPNNKDLIQVRRSLRNVRLGLKRALRDLESPNV